MLLIIGKGFIGSEIAEQTTGCQFVHHTEQWRTMIASDSISLVVNAAAITGQGKCKDAGWDAVKKANVDLPLEITKACEEHGKKCLHFSTGAVYAKPHSTPKPEDAKLYAPNDYIRSKIEMEDALEGYNVTIFRIPIVIGSGVYSGDFLCRIRQWEYVQNTYVHLLYAHTLYKSVMYVVENNVNGIFNVADSEFQHLPSFVEDHYRRLPIWNEEDIPDSFTLIHLLDTTKARRAGIL